MPHLEHLSLREVMLVPRDTDVAALTPTLSRRREREQEEHA